MTMEGRPINLVPACHSIKAFESKLERGAFGHEKESTCNVSKLNLNTY